MRAIVITQYDRPEVLAIEERPDPVPQPGQVLIEVKAFGLNHAEVYFRKGAWGDVAEISGIECVGLVRFDPEGQFASGEKVMALVGGMGRSLSGSYAELTSVPRSNVVAIKSDLSWEDLAAIPESYATAWTSVMGILELAEGQTILVRGASSSLGQAAINIARHAGAHVIATTRKAARIKLLEGVGAHEVLLDSPQLSDKVRLRHPKGIDAALDIVGNTTILDTLTALRRGGRACLVGFLGGGGALTLEPVFQMPSGVHMSVFASALVTGTPVFPLSQIPFQAIADRVADGRYRARPAQVFRFEDIVAAHRLLESGEAGGKVIMTFA
ncbi:zinc-binding dehydrogenase [Methylovirgula sp. 4M-Z18]|uniref:zinc-binding dehydrogenase n=1 Tax=Methylovirgula sp. 4M-Z18 TaxID=2293567 RepID=UPI000E2F63BB|nr:zinc-binding dehydrogenase [Methylovirgula sp. 4M-Z18]RFB75688.1 alcohol dehydrogenase [Methylovirgula sp. 4M-Z18]